MKRRLRMMRRTLKIGPLKRGTINFDYPTWVRHTLRWLGWFEFQIWTAYEVSTAYDASNSLNKAIEKGNKKL